ncbi:MAG: hypothetical protein JO157_05900 [Acetobacteraceae bacterium]|nr:hypothetical protein [Acetobacteraceae bacterium]
MKETGLKQWGPWARGLADAAGIPNKAVADQAGIHESTVSRFFNGIKDLDGRQFGLVLHAIGHEKARKEAQR